MKKLLTPGVVVALLTIASAVAKAAGYPVVGVVLDNPDIVGPATDALNGIGTLVAGVLAGVGAKAASAN